MSDDVIVEIVEDVVEVVVADVGERGPEGPAGAGGATAYDEIVPSAGGVQAGATEIGVDETLILAGEGTADGHSVCGFSDAGAGSRGHVRNGSGFVVRFYPPAGATMFYRCEALPDGDDYLELGPGMVSWLIDNDGNWWVD